MEILCTLNLIIKTINVLKKIISNTLSQIFSKIITATITIFILWLITNYLSIELFWVYNKIFNYIFIFAFLVDLGLYTISIKELSINKENSSYIYWNILSLRLISASLVIIFSIIIAYIIPWYNDNLSILWIFIASIFAFFSLINSSLLALMQAYMKMEFSVISVITNKIFVLLLTFISIVYIYPKTEDNWLENWLLLIIWSVSTWMFINMILNYLYARKLIKIKFYFDIKYIKELFFKSLPYWIALFLSVVYTKIDIILISLMEKWIIAERSIALYSLPLKIMDVLMLISWFFMTSLLPSISKNYQNKDFNKLKKITELWLKIMYSFSVIIISLGLIYKEHIIKIIATEEYLKIWEYNQYTSNDAFSIMLFMLLFFYLWIVFSYFLIWTDNQKKLLKISIILTLINIIWNLIFIPYFSFFWSWIVTIFTQIVYLLLVYFEAKKIITIDIDKNFILKISLIWVLIYFISNFLIKNYPIWLYNDFLYWIIITILYIIFIFKKEFKQFKNFVF